ncbi:transposase [Gluconobacter wancherniae]|nr:transposase [Gluconobacter wancherniae]
MLGDRGYDADWFRDALEEKGIRPCIPGRRSRRKPVRYDKRKYKRRNRIEIMFGRLKDWRRVATRYDRCPNVFFSAICLAAAHLNHDPTSNRWRNRRALCQRRLTLRRRLALGDLFEGPYRIGMNLEAYETYYD